MFYLKTQEKFLLYKGAFSFRSIFLEKKLFDETEIEHFSSSSAKLDDDILYQEAKNIVLTTKIASISMLQRRLNIGFNRAAKFVEKMEEEGIVGPYIEGKPRKVLISNENRER